MAIARHFLNGVDNFKHSLRPEGFRPRTKQSGFRRRCHAVFQCLEAVLAPRCQLENKIAVGHPVLLSKRLAEGACHAKKPRLIKRGLMIKSFSRSWRRRWRWLRFGTLRIAFNMACARPCRHCIGIHSIFVVHDGIEISDLFHSGLNQGTDGRRACHAGFAVAFHAALRRVDRRAVALKSLHKVGGHCMGNEFCRCVGWAF